MTRAVAAVCLLLLVARAAFGQEEGGGEVREHGTPGEFNGWFAPTTPEQVGDYLAGLAESMEAVSLDTLAWVDGSHVQPDSALPVLLARVSQPPAEGRERLRVLILAGQRGEDHSGTEVSLQIVRELVLGEIGLLLDDLEFAVVPAANPWGLLWWMADEPSGIDPARDHARLRSPATRAVHELASRWQPHLVVELRELGPAVYRVQAGLPRHPNVDPALVTYGRFYLLPHVANELARASVTFREFVGVEPEADGLGAPLLGARGLPEGGYFTPGALGADHAGNSFALMGSLTIMLGVSSMGGVEGLPDRVQLLYQALGYLLEVAAAQADVLRQPEQPVPSALSLRHSYARDEQRPDLVWLVWNERGQMVQETTDRWRSFARRQLTLPVPAGWVIEETGRPWAELVAAHGFVVERLRGGARLEVGSYPVGATRDLPPGLVDGLPLDSAPDGSSLLVPGERAFAGGTWLVRADQPRARLLFTLLEPWSVDAPLGLEAASAEDVRELEYYPVHRIPAGTSLRSLRTDPGEFGAARSGPSS